MKKTLLFSFSFLSLFFLFTSVASAQVVINEFSVTPNPEWVEFYNASSSAEFIKNYWLDDDTNFNDDSGTSSKKQLTGLNTSNSTYPYIEINSFLNNSGDYVVLFDPGGNLINQYQYTSNPGDNVSIGRSPDNSGGFTVLSSATKGSSNSGPQPTPTPSPSPSPSLTPTPTPTPTPSPSPKVLGTTTKKTTKKKSPKPTLVPVAFLDKNNERKNILGEETESDETEEASPSGFRLAQGGLLSWILTGSGLLFLIAAGIPFVKARLSSRRSKTKSDFGKMDKWPKSSLDGDQSSSGQE